MRLEDKVIYLVGKFINFDSGKIIVCGTVIRADHEGHNIGLPARNPVGEIVVDVTDSIPTDRSVDESIPEAAQLAADHLAKQFGVGALPVGVPCTVGD